MLLICELTNNIIGVFMVKYCKNCGCELKDDAVFCEECGTKFGDNGPTVNTSSNTSRNPFNVYKIDMIDGEQVIKNSEMHVGCFVAPGIILAIGFIYWLMLGFSGLFSSYYITLAGFIVGLFNPFLIIGLIWFVLRLIAYYNTELILTNKRVFGKCGLIRTTQMQSPLGKIDTVTFSNGLMGKILGYGTVRIATTSSTFKFRFIRDGHTLYSDIFQQLEINDAEMMEKQADAIAEAISKTN